MLAHITPEYYNFDEFESIQSEDAFTSITDFLRQMISIKIFFFGQFIPQ